MQGKAWKFIEFQGFAINNRIFFTRDRQIAAMTKSQQVHNGGKKAHKNEMERVLKEKDFFLKRYAWH